jgi:hypothetical protein
MMTHRADYYIEQVRYTKDHSRIIWVSIRRDSDKKLSRAYNMVRRKIVSLLRAGNVFMTIHRSPEGKYRKGSIVQMVQIKGIGYLRTDQDAIEKDQLQNIPEY